MVYHILGFMSEYALLAGALQRCCTAYTVSVWLPLHISISIHVTICPTLKNSDSGRVSSEDKKCVCSREMRTQNTEHIFKNFHFPTREWVKWVSKPMNGASKQSKHRKVERCGASKRSARCERTNSYFWPLWDPVLKQMINQPACLSICLSIYVTNSQPL